ncbi:predicted protein [Nematostella vectensis]|uniref:Alpha-type protein kinase domain-containing protein n=1 Tax=Nematostella vectensis TaxID=45351 RepID=A7S3Y8_NEMVE|nr:predicted protein [Nematostella vectensis]|eukprot:XP_001633633.1 predicted protein [Nematostella vectensis]
MHMLAKNIAEKLRDELVKGDCLEEYCKTLSYNTVYMGRMTNELGQHKWVTIEEYVKGDFVKYITNDGTSCDSEDGDMEIEQKCASLAHFSIEHSLGLLLIVDLQGSGHTLYDPEIASRDHTKDGKFLFAAGNLSQTVMITS